MSFQHRYRTSLSRDLVYEVHRDHLDRFGRRLPGIARVVRTAHERIDSQRDRLAHRWHGDVSVLPGPLKRVISADDFGWVDRTEWDAEAWEGRFVLDIPVLGDGARIGGVYRFLPDGDAGTEIEVTADLDFTPAADSPFLNTFVGRTMFPVVERFVHALFRRIMRESSSVISRYMEELATPARAA